MFLAPHLRFPVRLLSAIALVSMCAISVQSQNMNGKLPPDREALAKEIDDIGGQHIHMPKLPLTYVSDRYINVTPEFLRDSLKGKVVLIDIWDYTCINCIQTLPYIKAWNDRYKDKGLVIIGVHSPEFEFEKDAKNLDSAIKEFGLDYPIVADNEYEVWNSLANQYWPAKYLFDKNGVLRAEHFGEGEYQEFESFLQKILLERDPSLSLPEPLAPVRETDMPGSVCYRATPETYVGFSRNHLGNEAKDMNDKAHIYEVPKTLVKDRLYLKGNWTIHNEYAQPAENKPASLIFDYQAKEANLVIHPLAENNFNVNVTQDGKPVPKDDRGVDISEGADGQTYLNVREARMYRITNNHDFARHKLQLTARTPSFGAYTFTFTTACKH